MPNQPFNLSDLLYEITAQMNLAFLAIVVFTL